MKEGSIVQATIYLLDCFFQVGKPIDGVLADFFKKRKFIGAQDRREISKLIYDVLRNFELISFLSSDITNNHSRFFVLAFLCVIKKYSEKKIIEIFDGSKYGPESLTDFEKKFLKKIKAARIDNLPDNIRLNYPIWAEDRLHTRFKVNFTEEMQAFNHRASIDVRVNTLKSDVNTVLRKFKDDGVAAEKTKYAVNCIRINHGNIPNSYELLKSGIIEFQDEGSQLIAEFCNVKPNNVVVDFCAGAGGKTLALAAFMKNTGRIYATDKEEYRLERAKLRLRRAGVGNTYCNKLTSKWIKRHLGFADCVLVDAPCSGSGTWRRNPDAKIRIQEQDVLDLVNVQREILEEASKLVKVGGVLVYATCSIFKDEDENQIINFLSNHKNYKLEKISFPNGEEAEFFCSSPYKYNIDGFFCARLLRCEA